MVMSDTPRYVQPVLVTTCARLLLTWLVQSAGPLALIHTLRTDDDGEVGWTPLGKLDNKEELLVWDEFESCRFYVRRADVPLLTKRQIVLEVAFGAEFAKDVFTEFRLVSLLRDASQAQSEAVADEQQRIAQETARRLLEDCSLNGRSPNSSAANVSLPVS